MSKAMSKTEAGPAAEAGQANPQQTSPAIVKVRITRHKTHALGCVWAAGATVRLPETAAKALANQQRAEIIGV